MFNRFYALCFMISLCGCGTAVVAGGSDDGIDKGVAVVTTGLEVLADGNTIGTLVGLSGSFLNLVTVLSPDGYLFELNTTNGKVVFKHVPDVTCTDGTKAAIYQKGYDECRPLQYPLLHHLGNGGKGLLVGEYLVENCEVLDGESGEPVPSSDCKLSIEEVDLPLSYDLPITLVP